MPPKKRAYVPKTKGQFPVPPKRNEAESLTKRQVAMNVPSDAFIVIGLNLVVTSVLLEV